jgi:hypothetical protein
LIVAPCRICYGGGNGLASGLAGDDLGFLYVPLSPATAARVPPGQHDDG